MSDLDDEPRHLEERERALRALVEEAEKRLARRSGLGPRWNARLPGMTRPAVETVRTLPPVSLREAATTIADVMHAELGTIGNVHTTEHAVEWRAVHGERTEAYVVARVDVAGVSRLTLRLPKGVLGMPKRAFAKLNVLLATALLVTLLAVMYAPHAVPLIVLCTLAMLTAPLGFALWAGRPQPARAEALGDLVAKRLAQRAVLRTRVTDAIDEDLEPTARSRTKENDA
jgi:hypothetical protein